MQLSIDKDTVSLKNLSDFVFGRQPSGRSVAIATECWNDIEKSQAILYQQLEKKVPIYGVTTGYGDSCQRFIDRGDSAKLQQNLVAYLQCGTGSLLSVEASRAMFAIRLISLSRGYSGVSRDLLDRMVAMLNADIIPQVPSEGSLGASGDLIPLAYLGGNICGNGHVFWRGESMPAAQALRSSGISESYELKPKEGLAIVNGTATMSAVALCNLVDVNYLCELAVMSTSWLCIALRGKTEAFGSLINKDAKSHSGQTLTAERILDLLKAEHYKAPASSSSQPIQDRYSLRCAPQILGPIIETLELSAKWVSGEINSTSDNPVFHPETGEMALGGNFYGGHVAHAMDYLKICVANLADMIDRQITLVIDDKSNRGLPPNLAGWTKMPADQHHLHHGLKGLHQAINAITSEIMPAATPSSTFSRSSELHNQDKVSLGTSAAISLSKQIEKLYNVVGLSLICLTQALDLREHTLVGKESTAVYKLVRSKVPFVEFDQALGGSIKDLIDQLKSDAQARGHVLARGLLEEI